MAHRNSYRNTQPHHLYEIVDKVDGDTFKYGISSDPIGKDGVSSRMRSQINFLNRIYEWARFFGRILHQNIPGKKAARELERRHIETYETKNGRKPKGNVQY